ARIAGDDRASAALEMQACGFRELQRHAPVICAALVRLREPGGPPGVGSAVLLGQLGRCFNMGRRPDLAVAYYREAIDITTKLGSSDVVKSLGAALYMDLGDALSVVDNKAPGREGVNAA